MNERAEQIAAELDRDPVTALRVKEYISEKRLLEVLGITKSHAQMNRSPLCHHHQNDIVIYLLSNWGLDWLQSKALELLPFSRESNKDTSGNKRST